MKNLNFFTASTLLTTSILSHGSLLSVDMTVTEGANTDTQQESFTTVEELVNYFDGVSLSDRFPFYVPETSLVDSSLSYRGLPMTIDFVQGSQVLVFSIPTLNINETFDGLGSRDRALELLEEYLKGQGASTANAINREIIRTTPNSPLAGNPASLMNTMVDNAFNAGVAFDKAQANIASADLSDENRIGIGIDYAQYEQPGSTTDVWNVPLSYTWADENGRNLTIKLPLSYIDQEGSESYKAQLGISYQFPISDNWIVTPVAEYGATGSEDLYDGGQIVSGSFTSLFTLDPFSVFGEEVTLSMGNMVGRYETMKLEVDDYEVDPDVANTVTKNGLMLDTIVDVVIPLNVEYAITDTRYFGDELYAEQFNEIVISVRPAHADGLNDSLGLTLLYLTSPSSEDIEGFHAKLFWSF